MIRKTDIQWWVLEARKYPESASVAIEFLAERLAQLDAENEQLRNELLRLRQGTSAETGSDQVQALRQKVDRLEYLLKSQAATDPVAVLLSERMQSARVLLSQLRHGSQHDGPALDSRAALSLRCLLAARPHEELLLVTSHGRGTRQLVPDFPSLGDDQRWPNSPSPWLRSGERLCLAAPTSDAPRFWTIATRRGHVQRFLRAAFEREMEEGDPLLQGLLQHDEPTAIVSGDRGDLLVFTQWGYATRFAHRSIDVQGALAMELESGDQIVAALSLSQDRDILLVTASGCALRRHSEQVAARAKPGGSGKHLIRARDVLGAFPYSGQDSLLFLTFRGRLVLVEAAQLALQDRLGKGQELLDLEGDPAVAVALVPAALL
jgi:DNA gyrase/topoisomerase IV subunit A